MKYALLETTKKIKKCLPFVFKKNNTFLLKHNWKYLRSPNNTGMVNVKKLSQLETYIETYYSQPSIHFWKNNIQNEAVISMELSTSRNEVWFIYQTPFLLYILCTPLNIRPFCNEVFLRQNHLAVHASSLLYAYF